MKSNKAKILILLLLFGVLILSTALFRPLAEYSPTVYIILAIGTMIAYPISSGIQTISVKNINRMWRY